MFDIQEQLKLLPDEPGVYLMKNKNNKIIWLISDFFNIILVMFKIIWYNLIMNKIIFA